MAGGPPPAHHRPGGGFRNPWPGQEPGSFSDLLRWNRERRRNPPPPTPPSSAFPRAEPAFVAPRRTAPGWSVTWVGHSTLLLQLGGMNVLTDPMWSERASPLWFAGPRRLVPPAVNIASLPPIDVILLSHNHYDHCDRATIQTLARAHPAACWVVAMGLGPLVRKWGVSQVEERDWWESATITTAAGEARVGCAPARHFSARGPFDRGDTLWCGWTIATDDASVYFVGDTAAHPEFRRIGERFGPFDAVLMPVGAYEPRWFMRAVHVNPEEALDAFREVTAPHPQTAAVMVPIHWGTFRLTDEDPLEPPRRTRDRWREASLPDDRLWVLRHGETRGAAAEAGGQGTTIEIDTGSR